MTQDEIIEMAREACDIETDKRGRTTFICDEYGLEAFANLVAQEVRDRIMFGSRDDWVLAEREACANLCDAEQEGEGSWYGCTLYLAEKIRARGEQA